MTRAKRNIAIVASLLLAIPALSFTSGLVVFPLLFYALLAIVANFAPVLYAAGMGLRRIGLNLDLSRLYEAWAYCGIIWIGCAYGLSRWGDAASTMGAQNIPYLKVLFAPWLILFGVKIT